MRKTGSRCEAVRDALEHTNPADSVGRIVARIDVLAKISEAQREHLDACEDCRIFADELFEARQTLQIEAVGPQPGAFFLTRVMASIADREAQIQERESQTWAAVPRLAYRLSLVASLALLIAGSWLYQRTTPQFVSIAAADQHAESLVDGGTPTQDDLLVSLADR